MAEAGAGWKNCSACKDPIDFSSVYYVCNVSTCNRSRTALRFCSVSCWEVHLPVARHRESWAEERTAPTAAEAAREAAAEAGGAVGDRKPRRTIAKGTRASSSTSARSAAEPQEVLIVASRLKDYVRAVSSYNTSEGVLEPLSEIVRSEIRKAIEKARSEGRKTVLDRDVSS